MLHVNGRVLFSPVGPFCVIIAKNSTHNLQITKSDTWPTGRQSALVYMNQGVHLLEIHTNLYAQIQFSSSTVFLHVRS